MPFLQEYTMLDELGKGGFATVYKVRHNELGYIRAVRVLNETIVDTSSTTYQKFLHECKVLLRLGNGSHPNIVHIYQPRLLENKALVEMDYVDGQDISHYLNTEDNYVATAEVIRMATQISSALAYCHEDIYSFCMDRDLDNLQDDPNDGSKVLVDEEAREKLITKYRVIHNDIHSGNIMRRKDGNYVLLDFGLSIDGDEVRISSRRKKNGAPEFKPPEKWDDDTILSEQSDIYSFGIVLYQYLAGRVPFLYNKAVSDYKADAELAKAHQEAPPPPIGILRKEYFENKYKGWEYKKDYPDWLENMILKCLHKNPSERFKNGQELYQYIKHHNSGSNEGFYSAEINRLRDVANELSIKTIDLQNTNASLQTQLNESQNELSNTRQSLADTSNQKEQLQSELTEKRKKLKVFTTASIILAIGCMICGWQMAKDKESTSDPYHVGVSDEAKSLNDIIKRMEKQLKDKDEEIVRLNNEVKSVQNNSAEITRLNRTIADKENTIRNKDKEIDALKKDKRANNDNSAEISRLKASISDMERQTITLQTKLKKEQETVQTLKTQLADAKKTTSDKNATNSAELQINQKEEEISNLKSQLNNANNRIATLTQQLEKANKEIKALQRY